MHPAAKLQFERIAEEYARWSALAEGERPPAPAWWWGPAFELREIGLRLPPDLCAKLDLPDGATYAAGAQVLLRPLAGQTALPSPHEFANRIDSTGTDVRELHVRPSDDSAFAA